MDYNQVVSVIPNLPLTNIKFMQMGVHPSHNEKYHLMKTVEAIIIGYQEQPPDQRLVATLTPHSSVYAAQQKLPPL
jgi:hypothetical protein